MAHLLNTLHVAREHFTPLINHTKPVDILAQVLAKREIAITELIEDHVKQNHRVD